MHEVGLKAIADIVINHRCATYQGPDGKWNKFGGRLAWDASVICCNNPQFGGRGNPKQGDDYTAAPNIDHSQERVRKDYIEWLKYLRNRSVDTCRHSKYVDAKFRVKGTDIAHIHQDE
jgi:alpha-amylase